MLVASAMLRINKGLFHDRLFITFFQFQEIEIVRRLYHTLYLVIRQHFLIVVSLHLLLAIPDLLDLPLQLLRVYPLYIHRSILKFLVKSKYIKYNS